MEKFSIAVPSTQDMTHICGESGELIDTRSMTHLLSVHLSPSLPSRALLQFFRPTIIFIRSLVYMRWGDLIHRFLLYHHNFTILHSSYYNSTPLLFSDAEGYVSTWELSYDLLVQAAHSITIYHFECKCDGIFKVQINECMAIVLRFANFYSNYTADEAHLLDGWLAIPFRPHRLLL